MGADAIFHSKCSLHFKSSRQKPCSRRRSKLWTLSSGFKNFLELTLVGKHQLPPGFRESLASLKALQMFLRLARSLFVPFHHSPNLASSFRTVGSAPQFVIITTNIVEEIYH